MANLYKSLTPINTGTTQQAYTIAIGGGGSGGGSGGVKGLQNLSLQNLNFNWNNGLLLGENSHIKKYEIIETEEDILAVSVAAFKCRNKQNNITTFYTGNLLNKELFDLVTEKDREHANSIRNYYSKKIMLWKLKGIKLTKFREDLNDYIHGDNKKFKEEYIKIAYSLPNFYDYDTKVENLLSPFNKILPKCNTNYVSEIKKITYIGKTIRSRKTLKRAEYWYHDDNMNIICMAFAVENPLLPILESFKQLTIDGIFFRKTHEDIEYYSLSKYKFIS